MSVIPHLMMQSRLQRTSPSIAYRSVCRFVDIVCEPSMRAFSFEQYVEEMTGIVREMLR